MKLRFRVQGFRVQGFRVQGFRAQRSGVQGSRARPPFHAMAPGSLPTPTDDFRDESRNRNRLPSFLSRLKQPFSCRRRRPYETASFPFTTERTRRKHGNSNWTVYHAHSISVKLRGKSVVKPKRSSSSDQTGRNPPTPIRAAQPQPIAVVSFTIRARPFQKDPLDGGTRVSCRGRCLPRMLRCLPQG